ncbi:MAG: DUF2079 domain-containing protein, partial [Acidimicrobiales bacterium]
MTAVTVSPAGSDRARAWPPQVSRRGPAAALAGMLALYVGVFGRLTWRQHASWRSLGFDTGIYDQGMWLLSQGRDPFMTIRGMDYWGHHVALIGYLFAPVYWLGGGVEVITLIHTAWVAAGAVPLWLLTRDRLRGHPVVALAVPVAYLLHPAVHWVTWWLYHPDSMAITPLLFAWWLARAGRWRWFAVACGVALLCKEDVALAVIVLGVVLAVRHRRGEGDDRLGRIAGLATAAGGAAWFLVCSRVVIPLRNDHAPAFYESYFPSLGASLGEILRNLVVHPSRPLALLRRPRVPDYALKMLGPVGFVLPFLGPLGLLVAGPQVGVNLLVEVQDGATVKSQYASLPIVGLFLGLAEGMALLRRRPSLLRAAAAWLVGCALVGTHLWGLSPLGRDHGSVWAGSPRPNQAELDRAHATVPPLGRVAAQQGQPLGHPEEQAHDGQRRVLALDRGAVLDLDEQVDAELGHGDDEGEGGQDGQHETGRAEHLEGVVRHPRPREQPDRPRRVEDEVVQDVAERRAERWEVRLVEGRGVVVAQRDDQLAAHHEPGGAAQRRQGARPALAPHGQHEAEHQDGQPDVLLAGQRHHAGHGEPPPPPGPGQPPGEEEGGDGHRVGVVEPPGHPVDGRVEEVGGRHGQGEDRMAAKPVPGQEPQGDGAGGHPGGVDEGDDLHAAAQPVDGGEEVADRGHVVTPVVHAPDGHERVAALGEQPHPLVVDAGVEPERPPAGVLAPGEAAEHP